METIHIQMLGEFTLSQGENRITEAKSRAVRCWQLLAYLICQQGRVVSPGFIMEKFWNGDTDGVNPENALRTTLHRTRAILDGLWKGAGKELILYREGGYCWNTRYPAVMDFQLFEELCHQGTADSRRQALSVYRGEFLPRFVSEEWVIPLTCHFHNLFLEASLALAQTCFASGSYTQAAEVCRRAAAAEPYHEPLHQLLMQALAAAGDKEGARDVYETLSKRLFDDFGVRPNDQTRQVYRQTACSPTDRVLPMDEVMEHLQEPDQTAGAMECGYEDFKVLCRLESRAMERSGSCAHILLLSLSTGAAMDRPRQEQIMDYLGQTIRKNLRRGDVFARCSVSQYIVMLSKANYENSTMVCLRLLGAFRKAHPIPDIKIHYMVQPLSPSICVP